MIVVDTNVVLYNVAGKLTAALPTGEYSISVISEIELLSFPGLTAGHEADLRTLLDDLEIIDLTPQIKERTIEVRRRHRLTVPDAIVAATAIERGAELITNDKVFARVDGLRWRAPELRTGS